MASIMFIEESSYNKDPYISISLHVSDEKDMELAEYILLKFKHDITNLLIREDFDGSKKLLTHMQNIKDGLNAANIQTAKDTTKES